MTTYSEIEKNSHAKTKKTSPSQTIIHCLLRSTLAGSFGHFGQDRRNSKFTIRFFSNALGNSLVC